MYREKEKEFNMDRRTFVKLAGTTAAALAFGGIGINKFVEPVQGAVNLKKFIDELPIPPVAIPGTNLDYPGADYYELDIGPSAHKFQSILPDAPTYGYGGASYLGPTIIAQKGKQVVIKFTNRLHTGPHLFTSAIDTTIMGSLDGVNADGNPWVDENRVCVHLHGGKVLPKFDGGPRDWFSPEGSLQENPYTESPLNGNHSFYIYEYPNDQPATMLWYHDHAWAITRFNPFAGLAAAYLLRDENDTGSADNPLGLPAGSYEVPIVLQDKLLDLTTGAMIYPDQGITSVHPKWVPEYFGDIPVVNGVAYPYKNVEQKRYRIRFLNGSNARFYNIYFATPLQSMHTLPIWVIGSEQGFLPKPVQLNKLLIAPGERFDTIVDFSVIPSGTNVLLKNNAKAPYPSGNGLGLLQIMQFRVVPAVGQDNTTPPQNLTLPAPVFPPLPTERREIVLQENTDQDDNPIEVLLDGYHYIDSINSINNKNPLFLELADSTKIWEFVNTTGDAHPMHTHLVPFNIIERQAFDVTGFLAVWNEWLANNRNGQRPSVNDFIIKSPRPADPEETGWKDTTKVYPGEVLRMLIKFELPAGIPSGDYSYPCHCHILEHEENDMMFQFTVRKS